MSSLTTALFDGAFVSSHLSYYETKNGPTFGGLTVKEQETKPVKHGAKKSSLRADAPPFVPQANRLLPKKKLPLSSTSEWKENEQISPFKS